MIEGEKSICITSNDLIYISFSVVDGYIWKNLKMISNIVSVELYTGYVTCIGICPKSALFMIKPRNKRYIFLNIMNKNQLSVMKKGYDEGKLKFHFKKTFLTDSVKTEDQYLPFFLLKSIPKRIVDIFYRRSIIISLEEISWMIMVIGRVGLGFMGEKFAIK